MGVLNLENLISSIYIDVCTMFKSKLKFLSNYGFIHWANPKTVNTRITSGMLLYCDEKANKL